MTNKLLIKGSQDWTFPMIEEVYEILERIAKDKYQLDVYPNQIEIISAEQMIDAYTSGAMPVYYNHWSFGEEFVRTYNSYKHGNSGLAYEVVINTNPAIAFLMEENTMLCQALVIAHACFGHNTFFKSNYLMKQWTDPTSIINYLVFAKKYIAECEEKYGTEEVEFILDAAHSLKWYGIDRYKRPAKKTKEEMIKKRKTREAYEQSQVNELFSTIPKNKEEQKDADDWFMEFLSDQQLPEEPEENILYFIEKHAPKLATWQREIIRIVRKISQYFYPNIQTNLCNEGAATFWHYKLIHDLEEEGVLDEGAMLEFYTLHTGVVRQQDQASFNVYALGHAMYKDIERVAMNPTEEDRRWFGEQEWVGSGDWLSAIKFAMCNFKNDSFIQQFLSPKVMRDFNMFSYHNDAAKEHYEITAIQDERGYREIRENLAKRYNISSFMPEIQIMDVDIWDTRRLVLQHNTFDGRLLDEETAASVIRNIEFLWGYDVSLHSVDGKGDVMDAVAHSFELSGLG